MGFTFRTFLVASFSILLFCSTAFGEYCHESEIRARKICRAIHGNQIDALLECQQAAARAKRLCDLLLRGNRAETCFQQRQIDILLCEYYSRSREELSECKEEAEASYEECSALSQWVQSQH